MIIIKPIGIVKNSRIEIEDDNWGGIISEIVVTEALGEESLKGLEEFSHAEIIFHFHQVDRRKIVTGARYPRNNPNWPKIGIFAQRGKNRPNRLGLAIVKIIKVENGSLFVSGLDAIDGTPVIDIKPAMKEFLPAEPIQQPQWSTEIMENYWNSGTSIE
jgi:tRNA-Thr(GGU) m(6)t(6)A37 methyltransferase TsaA